MATTTKITQIMTKDESDGDGNAHNDRNGRGDDDLLRVGNNSNNDDRGNESDDSSNTNKNVNDPNRNIQAAHHQSAPLAVLHLLCNPAGLLFFFKS